MTPADSEEIPLSTMRRVTARRLTESAAAPHFFLTNVVNVERLMAFRAEVKDRFAETGTRISVTDLLVRACAATLRNHPHVNSSWGQNKIIRHHRINIGVAVAVDDGLMVPVVTDERQEVLRVSRIGCSAEHNLHDRRVLDRAGCVAARPSLGLLPRALSVLDRNRPLRQSSSGTADEDHIVGAT